MLTAGFSLGIEVLQSPQGVTVTAGANVQLVCTHGQRDYRVILWYQQSPGDRTLKLIGYVDYNTITHEDLYKEHFKIVGDLRGNTEKNCSLFIEGQKEFEHSAVYYCAPRYARWGKSPFNLTKINPVLIKWVVKIFIRQLQPWCLYCDVYLMSSHWSQPVSHPPIVTIISIWGSLFVLTFNKRGKFWVFALFLYDFSGFPFPSAPHRQTVSVVAPLNTDWLMSWVLDHVLEEHVQVKMAEFNINIRQQRHYWKFEWRKTMDVVPLTKMSFQMK